MSVGRAGSDLHVARVLCGDKAEVDEMVESAAVVRPLARIRDLRHHTHAARSVWRTDFPKGSWGV